MATEFSETATAELKSVSDIKNEEQILDLGDASAEKLAEILKNAKTILWNGPVGVFEFPNFRKGTEIVANAIADSEASPLLVAVIPWQQSICSVFPTRSPTSPLAAAHSSNSWKAKFCQQ
ncbi:Phosphoglycerate kinase [Leclercia adecarboxylata]|uniref:phosphoglycerate kinase n=1 Tax=Leclercia adecarboxylata TaxID=83655 RepID=A0A4U9IIP2_9ENTR|nr:Phosphoglycerate kinase [Leclercia adecarboxylata]